MIEIIVGVVGFFIVALASWWTDRVKKFNKRDYYDGQD